MSVALRALREKFDDIHKMTVEKEEALKLLEKGVKQISEEEKLVEKQTMGANDETIQTYAVLEKVKFEHDTEKLYGLTYEHMLNRMKKDLISLQLKTNDLTESLRSKGQIYDDENKKLRLAREAKLQSKFRLDTLMKNIDHEQKKRQERIISLQLSIKNKEEAL